MTLRLKALRSLRWNYTRKGVWFWLKGRQRCHTCWGKSTDRFPPCPACDNAGSLRGCRRILSEPEQVLAEQARLAEGAFV